MSTKILYDAWDEVELLAAVLARLDELEHEPLEAVA
jgi:hypothetical protein